MFKVIEYSFSPLPFFGNEFEECLTGKKDLRKELIKRLDEWDWRDGVDELMEYWFSHEKTIDHQILQSVKELKGNGIKCYIGTNNDSYRTEYLLNKLGLVNYFDGILSSAYLGYLKPEVAFWQAAYEKLANFKKEEILVWDDDKDNVISANKFGFQAELYTSITNYRQRMRDYQLT